MNDRAYNMYLKMIKLGLMNVKDEIVKTNMFNTDDVQVKIRGKDSLVKFVELIVKNKNDSVALYKDKVDKLLVIRSTKPQIRNTSASTLFIQSVMQSRDARIAQKQLINYVLSEMYFQDAWEYDNKHPELNGSDTAISKAKTFISQRYSFNFLNNIVVNAGKPHMDQALKDTLSKKAFNTAYSFATPMSNNRLIQKLYDTDFAPNRKLFMIGSSSKPVIVPTVQTQPAARKTAVVPNPYYAPKDKPITSETLMLKELYKTTFAALSVANRRRKFVNLKLRSNDILACPELMLPIKRQYSDIESMTKHTYIYDFYRDQMPDGISEADAVEFCFNQENHMYQYMWGTKVDVRVQAGRLYFPDSTNMIIPGNYQPYEFFHKVNATYAALFGFGPQDMRGGKYWLYDTVRKAYTDEGTADYRLAMIDARVSGRIHPRK